VKRARIAVLLAAFALLPQAGCALLKSLISGTFQKPVMTFKRADITSVSFSGVALALVMDAQNPNTFALDLGRIDYQLDLEGRRFATGQANNPVRVPARGTGEVTIPVEFRFADLAAGVQSLFTKDEVPYKVSATLGFNSPVGQIPIPVSHDGQLPVPKLPDIKLSGASLGKVGLDGTTVRVEMAVTNKNKFTLPLGNLNYRLKMEGTEVAASATPAPTLAANETTTMVVPIKINVLGIGGAVAKAISSRQVNLGLDGGLEIPGLGQAMPISQTATLNLR
jgi:LEA14-like dessication related protein